MQESLKKHFWYYITFFSVEISGVVAVAYFAYDSFVRMVIIILMVLFYVFWSLLHHKIHHSVSRKIVIEYLLIGLLGIVISLFFLA